MARSPRTPQGVPGACPVCGRIICLEPSRPVGDVSCPYCGRPLWFVQVFPHVAYYPQEDVSPGKRQKIAEVLTRWLGGRREGPVTVDDLDSVEVVAFVLDLEKKFGVTISDRAAGRMRSFGDLIDYLVEQCPE